MANDNEPSTYEQALERYIEYRTRFERVENDFDEYQQSSLNYEQELEVQLKQLDSQTHRLQQELFVERTQNEQYRERSEQTIKQFDKRFDQLQEELNACKNLNEKLTTYIRELEQTNDDLERSKKHQVLATSRDATAEAPDLKTRHAPRPGISGTVHAYSRPELGPPAVPPRLVEIPLKIRFLFSV